MITRLMILLAFVVAACGGGGEEESTAPTGDVAVEELTSAVAEGPFVSVPFDDLTANHVDPPVQYANSPAIGGDHYPFWQNCGFYDVEVIEGAAVHTLEHGAVWITYNEDAMSADDMATLESLAAENQKLLISPYQHDEPIVLSSWGVQLRLDAGPSDPQVGEFIASWQDNPVLPEAGVRCDGAVGIPPSEPKAFEDGSLVPDEFG